MQRELNFFLLRGQQSWDRKVSNGLARRDSYCCLQYEWMTQLYFYLNSMHFMFWDRDVRRAWQEKCFNYLNMPIVFSGICNYIFSS